MRRWGPTLYDFKDDVFDLQNPPGERRNVAGRPECQAVRRDLSARLDAFFDTHSTPIGTCQREAP